MKLNTIKDALEDIKNGKMVIVVDNEDRENEGDFIISSEKVKVEDINFMMKEGRGLICIAINNDTANKLDLTPMVTDNTSSHETNFTVSVDAIKDVTTGISAKDRWRAVKTIIDDNSNREDLARPGHMFPLVAKDGGVLQRAGHTEAAIDLAKLAGLKPSSLLVEIVDEDGTMARRDTLFKIAKKHNMKVISISDLISYRKKYDKLVEQISSVPFPTHIGEFNLKLFEDKVNGDHHVAIVKGDIKIEDDVLVRVHSQCLTGDIFGSLRCDCGSQLEGSLKMIEKEGKGILVYLRQEGRGIGLKNKIKAYQLQDKGYDTVEANLKLGFKADLREYGIGAQILLDCNVRKMKLLTNNPKKIISLEGFGLRIIERVSIEFEANKINKKYLSTKRDKLGHLIMEKIDK
jgi:3,4-dihydroxy 2-butanone 4-phosphate synthase/GTP cyclohydrolase II